MGESKIGTTGRGIGPAYEDKIARRAIRLQDLFYPDRFASKLRELLEFHNFVLDAVFPRRAGAVREDARRHAGARRCAASDGGRCRRTAAGRAQAGRFAAVRRRAGRAPRRRPRHLSVRDVVELPRRRRGARRGRRPAISRLRARNREGVRDARRHRPVSDRAHRRHRRAPRAARQRIRLGHRAAAALRLARHCGAQAFVRAQRRHRHVHHQARRAGRTRRDPPLHELYGARSAAGAPAVRRRRRRRMRAGLRDAAGLVRKAPSARNRSTRCRQTRARTCAGSRR